MTDGVRPFAGSTILLGVTGGIASYKSAWLARLLSKAGASVDVVLTRAATEFVGAITFEALTGRPVHTDLFSSGRALDHIALARGATACVIAPATADFMARAGAGEAGDLLSATLLATRAPVLFVPAMNDRMWSHPQTRANAAHLLDLGYAVLEPDEGELAAGEGEGPGRMPEPETIFAHVGRLLEHASVLTGKRVVVTAGPTREAIDPVRFISNRSSGRMGLAIAEAAWRRRADVLLIAGPLEVPIRAPIPTRHVETTEQMRHAVAEELGGADVLIMAAAPADFQPATSAAGKIRKEAMGSTLQLAPTADILATTREKRRPGGLVVGFALETSDALKGGRAKLEQKGLDLIVVNDATEPGAGFGVETNRVTFLERGAADLVLPLMSKHAVADALLDRIEVMLNGR